MPRSMMSDRQANSPGGQTLLPYFQTLEHRELCGFGKRPGRTGRKAGGLTFRDCSRWSKLRVMLKVALKPLDSLKTKNFNYAPVISKSGGHVSSLSQGSLGNYQHPSKGRCSCSSVAGAIITLPPLTSVPWARSPSGLSLSHHASLCQA
ncbi:hypothetical protein KUCAC02_026021 [Chaenocephalus aceratus]|uniref:Uncharacterized protein n=1 Tax=Chaenocephalus aceratus TaxID=36190 RepID=A0ACB9VW66_CHAAC|nr:hypothetical protein KUCAC02_026021 [Chaenocephalus aceratus]